MPSHNSFNLKQTLSIVYSWWCQAAIKNTLLFTNFCFYQVISLILSDVIGDPLDQIASGPTVPCDYPSSRAFEIIDQYAIRNQLPQSILQILQNYDDDGLTSAKHEHYDHVHNYLIGNNLKALQAAESVARELDYATCILSTQIRGEAKSFGEVLGRIAKCVMALRQGDTTEVSLNELKTILPTYGICIEKLEELQKTAQIHNRIAILSGGETVVKVTGQGKGGRNQEISLAFGIYFDDFTTNTNWNITLLAAGTDGQDGPTDAAGAVAYLGQFHDLVSADSDPRHYLHNNDSNTFYKQFKASDLVITGITNTNVMDVHILLLSCASNSK